MRYVFTRAGIALLAILFSGCMVVGSGSPTTLKMALARNSSGGFSGGPGGPGQALWLPDAAVYAMQPVGNTLYIGGDFQSLGVNTGSLIALDSATGTRKQGWPWVSGGSIEAVIPDPLRPGGFYIGGSFYWVDSYMRRGLARILPDGHVDPDWSPSVTGMVNSLAARVSNTGDLYLYVGGMFGDVNGQPRSNLAAIDDRGNLLSWYANADSMVRTLSVGSLGLYVGGYFSSISHPSLGTFARSFAAALDLDTGAVLSWNPSPNNNVEALLAVNGSVIMGGNFSSLNGGADFRNYLAAVDDATAAVSAWNPSPNGTVYAIAYRLNRLYVGGTFSVISGNVRMNVAEFDVGTGLTAWNPGPSSMVRSIFPTASGVYLGGPFQYVGGYPRRGAALVDNFGNVSPWQMHHNGASAFFALSGSTLMMAGDFQSAGRILRDHLAAIDLTSGKPTSWTVPVNGSVFDIEVSGSRMFIGGAFSSVGPVSTTNLAAIDIPTASPVPGWSVSTDNMVRDLLVSGTTLYAAGSFTMVSGFSRSCVVALDAGTGNVLTMFNSPIPVWSTCNTLALSGAKLFVGGAFTYPRDRLVALAAWDGVSGGSEIAGWSAGAIDGDVQALALSPSGKLYVGGYFDNINGSYRPYAAAVSAADGSLTGWSPGVNNLVTSIALAGDRVYLGGSFSGAGGNPMQYGVAAFYSDDATTGIPGAFAGFGPSANSMVMLVREYQGTVYLGGMFNQINGWWGYNFLVRLSPNGDLYSWF